MVFINYFKQKLGFPPVYANFQLFWLGGWLWADPVLFEQWGVGYLPSMHLYMYIYIYTYIYVPESY